MRVLIDTDIGDDIDDALALALALRHPEIELVGVTTVFRDTLARARMARYLLDLYGHRDVPVYAGSGKPLMEPMPRVPHEPQLDLTPADVADPQQRHAVEAILTTYAQPGSDVTLVTIGPLTNLALALAIDPTLAERIPRVVTMGGQIGRTAAEWNIVCDPEAAAIVLRAGLRLTLVPLDVTLQTGLQDRHIEALTAATDQPTRWLMTLTRAWQAKSNHLPILHDPLAVAVALDPGRVKTQPLSLDVVTDAGPGRGITCVVRDTHPPVDVALEVDGEQFVDWYVEQIVRT
jgi:inosine-uridine nucleoside N-ribohydrolase